MVLFHLLPQLNFTTRETVVSYYHQKLNVGVSPLISKQFKTQDLRKLDKFRKFWENHKICCKHSLGPSQSSSSNRTGKLIQISYQTFHRKLHFTQFGKFVSNILWRIAGCSRTLWSLCCYIQSSNYHTICDKFSSTARLSALQAKIYYSWNNINHDIIDIYRNYNIYYNLNKLHFTTFSSESKHCFALILLAALQIAKCETLIQILVYYTTYKECFHIKF